MIGINVKGEGTVWMEDSSGIEIGTGFDLVIAGKTVSLLSKTYKKNELEDGKGTQTGIEDRKGLVSLFTHDYQYSTNKYIDFRDYNIQRAKQERTEGNIFITQRRATLSVLRFITLSPNVCVFMHMSLVFP